MLTFTVRCKSHDRWAGSLQECAFAKCYTCSMPNKCYYKGDNLLISQIINFCLAKRVYQTVPVIIMFFTAMCSQGKKSQFHWKITPNGGVKKKKIVSFIKPWLLSTHLFSILCDKMAHALGALLLHTHGCTNEKLLSCKLNSHSFHSGVLQAYCGYLDWAHLVDLFTRINKVGLLWRGNHW